MSLSVTCTFQGLSRDGKKLSLPSAMHRLCAVMSTLTVTHLAVFRMLWSQTSGYWHRRIREGGGRRTSLPSHERMLVVINGACLSFPPREEQLRSERCSKRACVREASSSACPCLSPGVPVTPFVIRNRVR